MYLKAIQNPKEVDYLHVLSTMATKRKTNIFLKKGGEIKMEFNLNTFYVVNRNDKFKENLSIRIDEIFYLELF